MSPLDAAARQNAVVVSHADWGTLRVSGPDQRSWLQGLVTCDLESLRSGQGAWGLALNRQGKIQSVLWIVASDNALWVATAPGTLDAVEAELGRMLIMEDAELERPAEAFHWFALHGPEAPVRAEALAREFEGAAGPIDWTGLGGAALVVPSRHAAAVIAACSDRLLDATAWTRLRLERNLPEYGVDFDASDRPHEAALERRAVNWSKGCYLGQEVVCMQDMRGKVKRSVALLRVAAGAEAALGGPAQIVDAAEREVGAVTSRAFSQRAGGWLVLAQLDRSAAGELKYVEPGPRAWPAQAVDPIG